MAICASQLTGLSDYFFCSDLSLQSTTGKSEISGVTGTYPCKVSSIAVYPSKMLVTPSSVSARSPTSRIVLKVSTLRQILAIKPDGGIRRRFRLAITSLRRFTFLDGLEEFPKKRVGDLRIASSSFDKLSDRSVIGRRVIHEQFRHDR